MRFLLLVALLFVSWNAVAIDCSPLDPRDSVSKQEVDDITAAAKGSAASLLKIMEGGGTVHAKIRKEVNQLHSNNPRTDSLILNNMVLYLFCTMLEGNSVPDSQKLDRLQTLAESLNTPLSHVSKRRNELKNVKNGFSFSPNGCRDSAGNMECTVAVSNLSEKEQDLRIVCNENLRTFSSLFGANGEQRKAAKLHFGDLSDQRFVSQSIPAGLTINAAFTFTNLDIGMFPAALRLVFHVNEAYEPAAVTIRGFSLEQ